jgi:tyrosine-protein kinase Etk/Wzc
VGASDRSNGKSSNGHHDAPSWLPPARELDDNEKRIDLAQLVGTLWAGRRLAMLITIGVVACVLAITMATRMKFNVASSIYMGDLKSTGGMLDVVASQLDVGLEKGDITTEIEILKSRKLLTQAILASGLNAKLHPADWSPPRYLGWRLGHRDLHDLEGAWSELRAVNTRLTGITGTGTKREVDIKFKTATDYEVRDDDDDRVIGEGTLGKPLAVAGLELTLVNGAARGPKAGSEYELEVDALDDVLDMLDRYMTITAPRGSLPGSQADIVHLELQSDAPFQASAFLDELIHVYLDENLAWKTEAAAAADKFLSEQLEKVRASLDKAGRELAEFKKKSSTIDLGEEAKAMIAQIGTLEQQRVTARLEVDGLTQLKSLLAKGNVPTEAYLVGEAQDTVLMAMGQALVKAQQDYKALAEQFTPDYPPLKEAHAALNAQLQSVQSYVDTRLKRAREQLASLDAQMDQYNTHLKELPDAELKLVTLTQETEVYSKLYEFLLERQQEAALTKASTVSENRVLDSAVIPSLEASPKLKIRVPLAVVLGLFLGFGVVLARWKLSTRYQSESEIRKALPGLPLFASVPRLREARSTDRTSAPQPFEALRDVRSAFAEAFRLLRTNLYYSGSREHDRALLVTSPGPGDGKTATTLCLATILAADGKRVLTVDADMRKPSHHILLRQPQQPGLSGILTGELHWEEAVHVTSTPLGEFSSITTGITPPNPAELLSSPLLAKFIAEARMKFDFILIDSPPFPLVSDALVLSHQADRILSVLRVGTTHRRAAEDHLRRLAPITSHLGIVINETSKSDGYGYGYGYGYGKPELRGKSRDADQPPRTPPPVS